MRCSHCGLCCEETEMMLSNADTERLEELGYDKQKFIRYDKHGFALLRNHQGFCVFYDINQCRCQVYEHRPLGCWIYPVVYSEEEGVIVDDLCPMKDTVTETELERKGRKVIKLLKRISTEATSRGAPT